MPPIRSLLYSLARLLGDVEAVASGSPARMARRFVNKAIGRTLSPLLYLRGPQRRRR